MQVYLITLHTVLHYGIFQLQCSPRTVPNISDTTQLVQELNLLLHLTNYLATVGLDWHNQLGTAQFMLSHEGMLQQPLIMVILNASV